MKAPDETQDATFNSAYNPFPEPQTIPAGWDASAILSAPQTGPVMDEDDSAEG